MHDVRTKQKIKYNTTSNGTIGRRKKSGFMRRFVKNYCIYILGTAVAFFAIVVTTFNANTTCYWIAHQDELPKSAKKLRKF